MNTTIILIIDPIQNEYYITQLAENYPDACIEILPIQADVVSLLNTIDTDIIGYIPTKATPIPLLPENIAFPFIAACPPDVNLPAETAKKIEVEAIAWMASTSIIKLIQQELYELDNWTILNIANILESKCIFFHWAGFKATRNIVFKAGYNFTFEQTSKFLRFYPTGKAPLYFPQHDKRCFVPQHDKRCFVPQHDKGCFVPQHDKGCFVPQHDMSASYSSLSLNSKILAIVPHYHCEKWLRRCLQSLCYQTRPLDGIVVVDDGSGNPPVAIVKEFANVTLLASSENVGPYRLVQQVIEETNYDAYMFQDADDWSSYDRLSRLLQAAVATGSHLVGTQEFRVYEEECFLHPVCYPLDVNLALAEKPGHGLLHPTSLVTRELVLQLGGFATGLKFGGDTEFLLRAAIVARVINVPYYCYFRSLRAGSLTTNADTGLDSPARKSLLTTLKARAYDNYAAIKEGKPLCLTPLIKEAPIKLTYVTGPGL